MLQTGSSEDNHLVPILDKTGNKVGDNVPLNQIEFSGRTGEIRSIYANLMKDKEQILEIEEKVLNSNDYPYEDIRNGCTGVVSNSYRCIISECLRKPFIFKYKQRTKTKAKLEVLSDYYVSHLKRSISKTVMGDSVRSPLLRGVASTYILYDYWFYKKDTIREVTLNVIVDLRSIISYIIDNSCNDYYRNLDTSSMVSALRACLNSQELLFEGNK